MRIVVEPGSYLLENVGDVAMLQVAVRRLRELWPTADIHVVTEAPQQLPLFCPGTTPVLGTPTRPDSRPGGVHGLLSRAVWNRIRGKRQRANERPAVIAAAMLDADLIVVSGMGGLNDSFAARAGRLVHTLERAIENNIPAVLLGQGIGPLREPRFRERLSRVLTRAGLIALRERLAGPPLLDQLGVPRDIVRITGDDAIEMAYEARPAQMGRALGINVRVAHYAGVSDATVDTLRGVLRDAAARLRAEVLPVPISHRHGGLDARTNRALLGDLHPASDGGASLRTPLDVIHQVGRCRLVVAGSYHAGVFALAQGIPVVGLVNSPYYADKFRGLADMFGAGCEIVRLDEPAYAASLAGAIDRAWASAESLRPRLLTAAAAQVESARDAYRDVRTLVDERRLHGGAPSHPAAAQAGHGWAGRHVD